MFKVGSVVFFRDRSNHRRKGKIDQVVVRGGDRLYRVNGSRWFEKDGLSAA